MIDIIPHEVITCNINNNNDDNNYYYIILCLFKRYQPPLRSELCLQYYLYCKMYCLLPQELFARLIYWPSLFTFLCGLHCWCSNRIVMVVSVLLQ